MSDHDARALLQEALALFNDHPRFSLRGDRRRTSYALAARIDAYLGSDQAPDPAIAIARERWSSAGLLRIDEDERTVMREDDAIWVRSWVRVGRASLGEIEPEVAARYQAAVRSLPDTTRTILLFHQRESLSVSEIARRLQITSVEVERHIGEALASIASALDRSTRD
ncbi:MULTISPECIES: sigma-70 region 4 domain-containing protein [unclassified Sphingobium]|uniref:sigma-70 region 4 domain-containing protein n=1 Tax=unclassified Sphingobium TaxID=2611147 RepID=UPI002225642A|nr:MULTISPECIES: sigma-70 region 4 domain-containing protein [unclassified Sphingobium]